MMSQSLKRSHTKGFIAHRHSQSVLSILAKLENCKFISAYESEWALNEYGKRTFEHLKTSQLLQKETNKKIYLRDLLIGKKKILKED